MRVVIIGNSGSGKSTLAARLATERGLEHLDLDTLAWRPTQPPERIPMDDVSSTLREFVHRHPSWVAEGCYADLAHALLADATELIFLDVSVEQCQRHARMRPWEPHKYPSKAAQDANLEMLLGWIAQYPDREGPLGRRAHQALFDAFVGTKERRA